MVLQHPKTLTDHAYCSLTLESTLNSPAQKADFFGVGKVDIRHAAALQGATIHAKTETGQTPLDLAREENRQDIVELLIAAGARSSSENKTTSNTKQ